MKRKLGLFLFLLTLFLGFVGVRFFLLSNREVDGKVRIVSSPSATVFIDNVALGKTPYTEKIKVGEYLVKLIPESTATATASWQGKVQIYQDALSYVNRELGSTDLTSAGEILTITKAEKTKTADAGEIYAETEPAGAIVYLDNDEKGVAPLILADIPKGDHELSVFMPGFLRRTVKVNVTQGYRINASFKLAIDPTNQPQIENPSPSASPSGTLKKVKIVVKDNVKDTPLGYLRIREDASVTASESAKAQAGDTFDYLDEKDGWYEVQYDKNKTGWVFSQYADKVQQ